jgi:hypothetical protein
VKAVRRKSIQSAPPKPGSSPLELAEDLLARIEEGNRYARSRKGRFRLRAVIVKVLTVALSAASTVILGLRDLDPLTGTAFALVTVVTVVSALEPFFAWRSLWVLMEEIQYRFYRLRDDVSFYVASTSPDQLDPEVLRARFEDYQAIWDQVGSRWLKYRQSDASG